MTQTRPDKSPSRNGFAGIRKALAGLAFGLLTTAIPFWFCVHELQSVHHSVEVVGRVSDELSKVRVAIDALSQTQTSFTAIAIDAEDSRRESARGAARDEMRALDAAVAELKVMGTPMLSTGEKSDLLAAFDEIGHSWREILRENPATMEPNQRRFHFLNVHEASKNARALLQKVEDFVEQSSRTETASTFDSLRSATIMLLLIMLVGVAVNAWSLGSMSRSNARERAANVALRERDDELQIHSARFEAAIENMSQGLCMFDKDRKLIIGNGRYATLYGLSPEQLTPGMSVEAILAARVASGNSPKDAAAYVAGRMHEAKANDSYKIVHELVDGRFIAVSHEPLPDGGWVATHEDITDKKRAETRIAHMAHHDALTGLPNRVVLGDWLEKRLARPDDGDRFAIHCLDLDMFKRVNDTLGHQFGDMLLCQVAERLKQSVRDTDLVVRLGGDEFAIVQSAPEQPEAATRLAQRIIEMLNTPFDLDGHQIVIGTSIGVSIAPNDGEEAYELIKNADLALYRAKADGRNVYRFFERSMDAKMQARRVLEVDLRQAIVDDQFELMYQPIINIANERISGFEALLRWNHPTRGRVSPDDFIPLSEEIGLITTIGEWVLRQACAEATTWPSSVKIAVNLSPVQFRSPNLAEMIIEILAETGLSPTRLELEVTEAVLVHEAEAVLETLDKLRAVGVRIAMDDFGTGYSSLSYLQKFPFDKIKIDKGFMHRTTTDKDAFAIVKAVISLGKSLGMTITAEGVETQEQFDRLVSEQCTEVQGYLFSAARPATEARRLISNFTMHTSASLREVA